MEEAAAVSRDGQFVAFLSDRDGKMDVWVTQVGSGQFHNLTRGTAPELVNPSVRTLGFTPDGAFVTYWVRKPGGGSGPGDISIWATPTLGGEPKPYLEDAAEFEWSRDGSHARRRRSDVCFRWSSAIAGAADLYRAERAPFAFSVVVVRCEIYLFCAGWASR